MKKGEIFTLIALTLVILVLFAGCNKNPEPSTQETEMVENESSNAETSNYTTEYTDSVVTDAETTETTAVETESEVETSETTAVETETEVETSETTAVETETEVETSETTAVETETEVETTETTAVETESEVETSETTAVETESEVETTETTAVETETEVETSETTAVETETEVETTETTAVEAETEVETSETTAVETESEVETTETTDVESTTVAPETTEETTEEPKETESGEPEESTTEKSDYFEENRIEIVSPDTLKSPDVAISGDGYDIYQMKVDLSVGYRYGCTYLYNDDGSIDAYFASQGSIGEWDWIAYRHSTDGGITWSAEKMVLNPTHGSMDSYSNCDPGVVYFNGYYYLGYTSTLNKAGACNNIYVARSKNPDGPFEKWNGSGWGGENVQPILYYTENYTKFGYGEPSFVELNGTLYIYYTNSAPTGEYTMVATADATNENWPATIQSHGAAIKKYTDSLDVKYVEEWGKFIAVGTGDRMTGASWLGFYESNDGLTFELVDVVRENTYSHLHNAGLSSRRNGHIKISEDRDKLHVIYAYGEGWGTWNTRVQPITLELSEKEGYIERMEAEKAVPCLEDPKNRAPSVPVGERNYVMVRTDKDVYEYALSDRYFVILSYVFDEYFNRIQLLGDDKNLSFSGYDESIIAINGRSVKILGVGSTEVEVRYGDELVNVFFVHITEEKKPAVSGNPIVSFEPVLDTYTIYVGERISYKPQARVRITYYDGSFEEVFVDDTAHIVTYEGYDENVIRVNDKGVITARAVGETEITVKYADKTCKIKVVVTDDSAYSFFCGEDDIILDYVNLDFTNENYMGTLGALHNASVSTSDEGIILYVNDECDTPDTTDASVMINYAQSLDPIIADDYNYIEITYKATRDISSHATRAQLFICTGDVTAPSANCQVMFNIRKGNSQTIKIKLSDYDWWTGELHYIRFDFFDYSIGGDYMMVSSIKLVK